MIQIASNSKLSSIEKLSLLILYETFFALLNPINFISSNIIKFHYVDNSANLQLLLKITLKEPLNHESLYRWCIFQLRRCTCPIQYIFYDLAFEKGDFNWKRNCDFFIMGFGYIAPALHMWYCKLLPRIQASLFSTVSKSVKVFGSMCFEQLVFAPTVMAAFFPINQMVMDRDIRSFQKGIEVLKEKI